MHTSYVSTAALHHTTRAAIGRLQVELAARTTEIASGRHADVGLALGVATGQTVAARMDLSLLDTLRVSNAAATARLAQTQTALADLETLASQMLEAAVSLPPGDQSARTIEAQAMSSLDRLADRLNASDGGSYLFGGIDTQGAPFARYADGPKAAVEAAFLAKFGMAIGSAGTETIDPVAMKSFLDNEFALLFDDPAWTTHWSSAASANITSRIAPSERVETSTNANEDAMRTLAKALTMVAALGFTELNQSVRGVILEDARILLGTSISQVIVLKGELGLAENAIASADARLALASDLVEQKAVDLERADPVEAKVRADLLTTQIEMSYAMTAQLARLSILNYA